MSRILFALDKYRTRQGGADRLARAVAEGLVGLGHSVRVLEAGAGAQQSLGGVEVVSRPVPKPLLLRDGDWMTLRGNIAWQPAVEEQIGAWRPDLVLTQNRLAPASVAAATKAGIRSAILFHGYACLSPTFFEGQDALTAPAPAWDNQPWRVRMKWPIVKLARQLYDAAYRRADVLVANSRYIQRVLELHFHRPAEMLYPILDLSAQACPVRPEAFKQILFVKPQRIKGLEVLLRVAPLCPDLAFTVVGHASRRVESRLRRAGIQHRGWVDDLNGLYAASAALFAPSRIPEPFGRVFVEAGLNGLPCVASRSGGIPEAVGDGGYLLPQDATPTEWADALRKVCRPEVNRDLSVKAHAHACNLADAYQPQQLAGILGL